MQTHPRTASFKEKKDQLIVTFEEVRTIAAASKILAGLGSPAEVAA